MEESHILQVSVLPTLLSFSQTFPKQFDGGSILNKPRWFETKKMQVEI